MALNLSPEEMAARKILLGRERNRRYREAHPERIVAKRQKSAEWNREYQKAWYQRNQERLRAKKLAYYKANRESILKYQREYGQKNKAALAEKRKGWFAERSPDPEFMATIRATKVRCHARRMKRDPLFRLICSLRGRLRHVVGKLGVIKVDTFSSLLGCTRTVFKAHLESQFEGWMNWDNYGFGEGKWVVDHIKPISGFDIGDPGEQRACFHYTNLRPLCWRKNMEKGSR